MLKQIILQEKTGASVWTDRANQQDPSAGIYSLTYAFAAGIHAVKVKAEDEAGNSADSSVIVFESASTRKAYIDSVVDDVSPQLVSIGTTFGHTNDLRPKIVVKLYVPSLTVNGETANVVNAAVAELKLYYAWKAYVTPETNCAIDFAQDTINTHATATGQGVLTSSSIQRTGDYLYAEFTPTFDFIANRIYTFGAKWKDSLGNYSAGTDAANYFSICVDTANPTVSIATPVNGYIYVSSIATVTGSVADTLV